MNDELDGAREALDRGDPKRALQLAWNAAFAAIVRSDRDGLDAAIAVAEAVRDDSEGGLREEAEQLATYAAYARDHPQPRQIGGATLRPRPRR